MDGLAETSQNDLIELRIAVEDSIFSLKAEVAFVTAQRDTAYNDIYIMESIHEATKRSFLDNFKAGFIAGIATVVLTGIVLNETWD